MKVVVRTKRQKHTKCGTKRDLNVWFQAEEVRRVADSELGFQQVALSRPTQAKTYLFVNTEHTVVGCLVAEHIRQVEAQTWKRVCVSPTVTRRTLTGFFLFFFSLPSRRTESWINQTARGT